MQKNLFLLTYNRHWHRLESEKNDDHTFLAIKILPTEDIARAAKWRVEKDPRNFNAKIEQYVFVKELDGQSE